MILKVDFALKLGNYTSLKRIPKQFLHNTAFSIQLLYIDGYSL